MSQDREPGSPTPDELAQLAAGRLPDSRAHDVVTRAFASAQGQEELQLALALQENLERELQTARSGWRPRWYVAAAAALLVVASSLWFLVPREQPRVWRGGAQLELNAPREASAARLHITWRSLGPDARYEIVLTSADLTRTLSRQITKELAWQPPPDLLAALEPGDYLVTVRALDELERELAIETSAVRIVP